MDTKYLAIIHLKRPVLAKYSPMSPEQRAAQFAPFAALSGYGEAIEETARLTEQKIVLAEDAIEELNRSIALLRENIARHPAVTVTYFQPDPFKNGGAYLTVQDTLLDIQEDQTLVFQKSGAVNSKEILSVEPKEE